MKVATLLLLLVACTLFPQTLYANPVITNAGYGCEDGYCIWILGQNFTEKVMVEVRTDNDAKVLANYLVPQVAYSSGSLAFGLLTAEERAAFSEKGLKVYLIEQGLRSNSYFVKKDYISAPPAQNPPVLENAGYGCEDGYCIWLLGKNYSESVSAEIYTADDSQHLASYSIPELSYSSASLALGLRSQNEKNLFSTQGLRVYLLDNGLKSNSLLVKRGSVTINPQPTPTPVPVPAQRELYFSYFGISDNSHLETADHTNLVMTASWGDWKTLEGRKDLTQNAILHMKESKERGVKNAMFTVDYLLFSTNWQYRGVSELRDALNEIKAAGLLDMIVAFYVIDEPDDHGINNQAMTLVNSDIRIVMGEFPELKNTKLAVFYTDHGSWPGKASFDWIGFDSYGNGPVKPSVSGNQKIMMIPGGANPWREGPEQFYNSAMSDDRVVAIIPFYWFDSIGVGIRSNGLAPRYRSVGCKISGRCNP